MPLRYQGAVGQRQNSRNRAEDRTVETEMRSMRIIALLAKNRTVETELKRDH